MLGDIAAASTGIDKAVFLAEIGSYRGRTVTDWKYAIRREINFKCYKNS